MYKTNLVLLSHCHVPHGSSEEDFENTYKNCARPFITALYRWPKVPACVHYSGVFLEWLNARHQAFIALLGELVNRKQLEMLGGGFYEPAFTLIPQADRITQIELQTTLMRKLFGKRPRGCLLPSFLWDPSLVGALNTCGMEYVFLGADQFRATGLSPSSLETQVLTEDQGRLITVLPVSDRCELNSLFSETHSFVRSLSRPVSNGSDRLLCFFPERAFSGNEAGSAREKLLDAFFCELSKDNESIRLNLAGKLVKGSADAVADRRRVYFPNSAQPDLMLHALEAEQRRAWEEGFLRDKKNLKKSPVFLPSGAYPRQFLMRYEESANLYAKMNYVHLLVNQLRGDKSRKKSAREELLKSQGLDTFIHIASGGIYANNLRKAAFRAQINAEKMTRQRSSFVPCLMVQDFRLDGHNDYLFLGNEISAYVKSKGGSVFELDHIPKAWNYLDTMARRKEPYVSQDCVQDELHRSAFMDFLLPPDLSFRDASHSSFLFSRQCAREFYEQIELDRVKQTLVLRLPPSSQGAFSSIELIKRYSLTKSLLTVSYCLLNQGNSVERFNFSPRIDLSLADEERAVMRAFRSPEDSFDCGLPGEIHGALSCVFEDQSQDLKLEIGSQRPVSWWVYPVKTRCKIKNEIVENYQSTCIAPLVPVVLAPGESWATAFTLSIGKL